MLLLMVVSALVALLCGLVLVLHGERLARAYAADAVQRFHAGDVPRLGGLAVAAGLLAGWCVACLSHGLHWPNGSPVRWQDVGLWALCALPVVAAGVAEDVTHGVGVRWRLGAGALSGCLAFFVLGLQVSRLDVALLDGWLAVPAVSLALTVFALAGLPHAFNLIDGYNGLAGMVAVLLAAALAHVAMLNGDRELAAVLLCLVGATLGFMWWNYPRGLLFAGDGGAYLWGVVMAMAAIALVQRHAAVSAWFVMLLLIYPVWETVFSIYRKLRRGDSPGAPDSMHFHQLVYKRVVRRMFRDGRTRDVLMRNNRTSPYLWALTVLSVVPAVLFWNRTVVLMGFCALFVLTYVAAYVMMVRFKVPRWMRC